MINRMCDRCSKSANNLGIKTYKSEPIDSELSQFELCNKCILELKNWLDRGKY